MPSPPAGTYQPSPAELTALGFTRALGSGGIWQHPGSGLWLVRLGPDELSLSAGQYEAGRRARHATKNDFFHAVQAAAPHWDFRTKRTKRL